MDVSWKAVNVSLTGSDYPEHTYTVINIGNTKRKVDFENQDLAAPLSLGQFIHNTVE